MEGCRGKRTGRCGLTRRAFIQGSAGALALLALPWRPTAASSQEIRLGFSRPTPAAFTKVMPKGMVQCQLCPRNCEVLDGDRGDCGVRGDACGHCGVKIPGIWQKPGQA